MPYRIDLPALDDRGFDYLVRLGALDVEVTAQGAVVLMPDRVTPDQVANGLGVAALRTAPAVQRDAGSVWVLSQRPVREGRLQIVPAHYDRGPGTVRLADSNAFGTGLHPTTALCLAAIDDAARHNSPGAVLDVGTGSGVLALAALTLGIPRAVGLDVDREAVYAAAANARLNGLEDRLQLICGGPATVSGAWPLVVANLVTGLLLDLAPDIVRRVGPKGRLLLSGIRSSTTGEVENAYRRWGMQRVTGSTREGWVALVLGASW